MIQGLYRESLRFNIGGMSSMLLSFGVIALGGLTHPVVKALGWMMLAGGYLAMCQGVNLHARAKGRTGWERALGLLSIWGVAWVILMADRAPEPTPSRG